MDARTREALEASIRHWEANLRASEPYLAVTNGSACALCIRFVPCGCSGCPVREATGAVACRNTPYYDAVEARQAWRRSGNDIGWREAAQAELDFLRSLLPATEEKA